MFQVFAARLRALVRDAVLGGIADAAAIVAEASQGQTEPPALTLFDAPAMPLGNVVDEVPARKRKGVPNV